MENPTLHTNNKYWLTNINKLIQNLLCLTIVIRLFLVYPIWLFIFSMVMARFGYIVSSTQYQGITLRPLSCESSALTTKPFLFTYIANVYVYAIIFWVPHFMVNNLFFSSVKLSQLIILSSKTVHYQLSCYE